MAKGYIGRIQNTGPQRVEAPHPAGKKDTGKVRRAGEQGDLRGGASAGRGKRGK